MRISEAWMLIRALSPFLRAQSFAERLRLGIAVIHGEAQDAESDMVDGRHSPPTIKTSGAIHPSMEIPCKELECILLYVLCIKSFSRTFSSKAHLGACCILLVGCGHLGSNAVIFWWSRRCTSTFCSKCIFILCVFIYLADHLYPK